jgi:signal transduction histidine kinase
MAQDAELPAAVRSASVRYLGGIVLLAGAYYGAAKLGQTLRYTGSVSAIWPPAGLGIAALYLWGLRWWPGLLLAECLVNAELLLGDSPLPVGSMLGQQAGNMAELIVGAILLRRLIGPGAALDRTEQVGGMLLSLGIATAISATMGTLSMLAGGVIEGGEAPTFWRTWWLGDTSGGLIVLPLMLTWAADPRGAWRRTRTFEGVVVMGAVAALGALAISIDEPVTYMVFPALIWAAFRFGPPGASLSIAIAAGVAIGVTANDVGPFFKQPIDHRTLSTQLYIGVAALTTLFLGAVVSERKESSMALAEAKRHEGEQAAEERHRIARDLHDSVSQSLFSTVLHTRSAQRALEQEGVSVSGPLSQALSSIGELTRGAQGEMRALIFELGPSAVEDGLVAALTQHASRVGTRDRLIIDVRGPEGRLAVSRGTETQLFGIGREAIANVVKHAHASKAWIRVEARSDSVVLEVHDDGRGFDGMARHPGHFGLESMTSRAAQIGGVLTLKSAHGHGTLVSVEVPADSGPDSNGGGAGSSDTRARGRRSRGRSARAAGFPRE